MYPTLKEIKERKKVVQEQLNTLTMEKDALHTEIEKLTKEDKILTYLKELQNEIQNNQ